MVKQERIIVETKSGKLEGVLKEDLYEFKGIPYAAPPVGDLRWLPPQAAIPWQGVRAAGSFGTIAPQEVMPVPGLTEKPEPQNEDCLFLNIYTPEPGNVGRPVMVWIHGGAFCMGSGSSQMFTTGTLASNDDIVLVTFNYRLGLLGFLNLNELTGGRIPSTGNEGLQDQVAALKWIKDNIAGFGGNPDNITVLGESAGAMSIGSLLNLPEARGLFHKAILESPVGEMARPLGPSVRISEEFLKIADMRPGDISGLRALPVEKLLQVQRELAAVAGQGAAPVIPVADGQVLPKLPLESLEAGQGLRIPVLVGSNLDEDKFFSMVNRIRGIDEAGLRKTAEKFVEPADVSRLIETYRRAKEARNESTAPFEIFSAINTDVMFRQTAIRIAEAQCRYAQGGYNYLFTWKSPIAVESLGACHALEIGFIFGNYNDSFCGSGPDADRLSRQMQDAWISFAKKGNPGCKSLGAWPPYGKDRATMILGRNSRLERAVYEEERRVWETLRMKKYSTMP
jgi:para-nitrobenzyl esterase